VKTPLPIGLALAVLIGVSAAADRDLDSNGVVDRNDVIALGRMVAGIDPPDLRYDQNGDGMLTLEDVEILLDAVPQVLEPGGQRTDSVASSAGSFTPGNDDLIFYAVYRKADGACVVVAGEEGITAGDTIYGAFPSYAAAEAEIGLRCTPGRPAGSARCGLTQPAADHEPPLPPRFDDHPGPVGNGSPHRRGPRLPRQTDGTGCHH